VTPAPKKSRRTNDGIFYFNPPGDITPEVLVAANFFIQQYLLLIRLQLLKFTNCHLSSVNYQLPADVLSQSL
jgi:hypothetical protein